ncbi:MAG: UDP-N-acetylmuramate dehydrogenase [Candidatus Omnitrophica bacterium]|nr:UDP-N-acetylmuramate dehydrogenase [Candidatus Omnitrophota bacterium]
MSLKRAELTKITELKDYTTIKIGGRASSFFLVNSLQQLRRALSESDSYYILGKGSNLLIADTLIEKPIIKLGQEFNYIKKRSDSIVEVGAATSLACLMNYCLRNDLSGLENLVGIPATIGGLLAMNASSYGEEISSKVLEVCLVDVQGNIRKLKRQDLIVGYRYSAIANSIIIWVRFSLSKSKGLKQRLSCFIQERLNSQDFSLPSCGCIFKNPEGESAGLLIEACGLKGVQEGGAQISSKHANFIVNLGGASYRDVDYLIQKIKSEVCNKYSIILDEEIKRWS